MSPKSELSNVLPTSLKTTQDSNISAQFIQDSFTYKDLNGDGVISPEEIEAQNKARQQ